ncbi:hypothetical protein D0809_09440 [Flavobacterium circumlabens]|uniref:Uncharacterized protein n=1 Tax=Flavobacterium circumlabens TaxID=2133765 RepID=A0A4Y7UHQ1_9FLAO|nr:hypothetical protein [Flavobacterium circumlabens]TCN60146.1 hypothetical protein EV142_102766 [Flavobacterium circumlabens]TEB45372.1 hypothetical protein D0809_09440 [Flavobacterium circumlabens]
MRKKKKMLIIQVFFILFLLPMNNVRAQKKYRIIEIDSTENFYFVAIKHWFKRGTIISPKNTIEINGPKIKVGKRYLFNLKAYNSKRIILGPNYSFAIEGRIVWYSDKQYNVYTSESLRGLYLD